MKLAQKKNMKPVQGGSSFFLGLALGKFDQGNIEVAEELILEGIAILEALEVKALYSFFYTYFGSLFVDLDRTEEAKEYLHKAEAMFQEMRMDYWLARTHVVYADLHTKEGETSQARESLMQAIGIFKECGADGWVEKCEEKLGGL